MKSMKELWVAFRHIFDCPLDRDRDYYEPMVDVFTTPVSPDAPLSMAELKEELKEVNRRIRILEAQGNTHG